MSEKDMQVLYTKLGVAESLVDFMVILTEVYDQLNALKARNEKGELTSEEKHILKKLTLMRNDISIKVDELMHQRFGTRDEVSNGLVN